MFFTAFIFFSGVFLNEISYIIDQNVIVGVLAEAFLVRNKTWTFLGSLKSHMKTKVNQL